MSKFLILNIWFVLLSFGVANSNPVPSYDKNILNHINDMQAETLVWETDIAYFIYGIIIIMLIYFLVQYRTKTLRKANQVLIEKDIASREVEKQRRELAIKNKNITDSIQYAKNIQEALLPSDLMFKKLFPDSFILFKPKDIVSGDFYWLTEKNNKVFISAVDCTGHGVPGAFMSLIGLRYWKILLRFRELKLQLIVFLLD